MAQELTSDAYGGCVGRTALAEDIVTSELVKRFRACLAPNLAQEQAGEAPLGLHWCMAPAAVTSGELGEDGHVAKGAFLPDVPLPRRMWAGGEIELHAPIRSGDIVERRSRIASVVMKEGRSGSLCFVGVEHEVTTPQGLVIRERQDIVYRDAEKPSAGEGTETDTAEPRISDDLVWKLFPTPVLLFRYSALTFNSHRIHYDQPYATGVEGYDGLVVHGPLQATLLLNAAASLGARTPCRFAYRGVSTLIAGTLAFVCATRISALEIQCEVRDVRGRVTMKATATW